MAGGNSVRLTFRLEAEQAIGPDGERVGISTADLVAFSKLCDEVAGAVVDAAAVRLLDSLKLPKEEKARIRGERATWRRSFSVGQVETVKDGSLLVVVGIGATMVGMWVLKDLLGGTVRGAWEESKYGTKTRYLLRDKLFGGAADVAAEAAARSVELPGGLAVIDVTPNKASKAGVPTDVRVDLRKTLNPECAALRQSETVFGRRRPSKVKNVQFDM